MEPAATKRPRLRHRLASWAARPSTSKQTTFDVVFGIVLPIVCLVFDPGILRSGFGGAMLGDHAVAAYAFILPAMVALAACLLWQRTAVLLAGPLLAGAGVALTIGIVLLPLSIPMSVMLIGLLGLVPFGTAIAFLRNGLRALHAARARYPRSAIVVAALSGLVAVALPVALERHLGQKAQALVQAALRGEAREEVEALTRLGPFAELVGSDAAIRAWRSTTDTVTQERLARIWQEATGQSLLHILD